MKKGYKIAIYVVIWYICFYIIYYNSSFKTIDKDTLNLLSLAIPTAIVFSIMGIIKLIRKIKIENRNNKFNIIKPISEKYKKLSELNQKYDFNDLGIVNRTIIEKEYSHKSFDRARANSIILYQIENNDNNIREFILNAYRNKKSYDNYLNDFNNINEETQEEKILSTGFSKEQFLKIENELLECEKIKDDIYNITIDVIVSYTTPAGKSTYKKNKIMTYQELCDLYMQWRNGKKYDETSKRERRYMTDQLRYDVLKRDNFTCQKCGATAKDGVKLHVDHIIPVYKGGKTTMSNLQTLCERCNIGKGTKDN